MQRNRSKYLNVNDVNMELITDLTDKAREDLKRLNKTEKKNNKLIFSDETVKFKQKIISFQICKLCSSQRRGNPSVNNWMVFVTEKGKECKEHLWLKEIERY